MRFRLAFVIPAIGLLIPASGLVATQMSASVIGSVVDVNGEPVSGATVLLRYRGDGSGDFQATTDEDGRFVQLGLQEGPYNVVAAKRGVGLQRGRILLSVRQRATLLLRLVPRADDLVDDVAAGIDVESAATAALQAGAAAGRAGNHQEAVTLYQQAIGAMPECHECHHRLGQAYAQLEDYAEAEAAFERAIEIDSEYVRAYRDLAEVYEAQQRFDEAAEARAKASALTGAGRQR